MTSSPADSHDRIAVVDVLRAFALLGIVVTHAEMGFLAGPPPAADFMQFGALDRAVHQLVAVFVESKFFSIFAFLFGLSFAIQIDRAAQKGAAFTGRFAWRLALLLLIGMAHQLLFNGDILMLYALLGFLLIPMKKVRSGILLVVALVLLLNVPGLGFAASRIGAPPPTPEQQQAMERMNEGFMVMGKELYEAMKSGSWSDIVRSNYTLGLGMKAGYLVFSGRLWITFGCFLLGMCAGRANLFRDSDWSRRFFRRLLVGAGALAAVSTVATLSFESSGPASGAAMMLATVLRNTALAATYVAAVTLLYWRHSSGVLTSLAPLGKMGLTTYLLQSVFLALVFYGIGLGMMGVLGHAAAAALGLAFFVAQVFLARWWLAKMSMGPVEWLWRSATQLRWQPLVRASTGGSASGEGSTAA
jgi:uncharacterized protein